MKLPTEQECLDLFKQYIVSPYILNHCLAVRKVAVFVAGKLNEAGEDINIELVDRLALLHDLFKIVVIESPKKNVKYHPNTFTEEEIKMGELLREKYPGMHEEEILCLVLKENYPELAEAIANKSSLEQNQIPEEHNQISEGLIVHYADWRSQYDKVVSLQERLAYLFDVYPNKKEHFEKDIKKAQIFEDKLKEFGIDLEKVEKDNDQTYEQSE